MRLVRVSFSSLNAGRARRLLDLHILDRIAQIVDQAGIRFRRSIVAGDIPLGISRLEFREQVAPFPESRSEVVADFVAVAARRRWHRP